MEVAAKEYWNGSVNSVMTQSCDLVDKGDWALQSAAITNNFSAIALLDLAKTAFRERHGCKMMHHCEDAAGGRRYDKEVKAWDRGRCGFPTSHT